MKTLRDTVIPITAHPWPLHEGNRGPEDFISFADVVEEGAFVLATHTWYICETYSGGILDEKHANGNLDMARSVIESLIDGGYRVGTMSNCIRFSSRCRHLLNYKYICPDSDPVRH